MHFHKIFPFQFINDERQDLIPAFRILGSRLVVSSLHEIISLPSLPQVIPFSRIQTGAINKSRLLSIHPLNIMDIYYGFISSSPGAALSGWSCVYFRHSHQKILGYFINTSQGPTCQFVSISPKVSY